MKSPIAGELNRQLARTLEQGHDEQAGAVYLNSAATGWPRAPGVVEAVTKAMSSLPVHPGRAATRKIDVVTECRTRLAARMKVDDPTRIILASNATHALNLAVLGLDLKPGEHVITTVTEHNSVLRPLNHLRVNRGVRLTLVGLDGEGALDRMVFERALKDAPRLVVLNHASNVTGRINEVAPLFEKARKSGALTLLDASQSLGHVAVHPRDLHADMVAFTGHKGLHGPPGTGGLYVSPDIELTQVLVGGTGVRSDLALHPAEMPTRLEAGTPNMPALAGLVAALAWLEVNGEWLREQEERVADRLRQGLAALPNVQLLDEHGVAKRIGVVSFRLDGWNVEDAGTALEESFGIVCRTGLHCAPLIHDAIGSAPEGTIRFSVSGFNTDHDVDVGIQALEQMSSCALSK